MVKRATKTTGAAKKTTKSTESKSGAKPQDSNAAPAQATAPNGGTGEQMAPSMNVLAQYVKDLSFENPNAPNSLRPREKPPEISININVNPRSLSENDFEVELKLDAKAADGDEIMFVAELVYAGLFRITGVPKEAMQAAVLIECPRLLFPFARQILADATRNGNFPPLMIDPVDFAQLFRQRMEQQQAAAGNA